MSDVPHQRSEANSYPPCPLSTQCERLADYLLDEHNALLDYDALEKKEDRQLLTQLHTHVPTCPTCSNILATIRAQRTHQRQLLRQVLATSEQQVPSNTSRIMQAIRREQDASSTTLANGHDQHTTHPYIFPIVHNADARTHTKRRPYIIQALVAAVAILVLSATLFSYLLPLHGGVGGHGTAIATATQMKPTPTYQVTHTNAWSSIIFSQSKDGQKLITTMDPVSGKSAVLATSRYPDGTIIDGVSHDGYQVLYHVFDGTKTQYYLQPSAQNTALYTLTGKGGTAIWSTDNSSVFISTPQGIEQVALASRKATLIFPKINTPNLLFYRDDSLYITSNEHDTALTGLNRIDITSGKIVPIVTGACKLPYDFWLSLDGLQVYYRCPGQSGLYAVNRDGTGGYTLRDNAGQIIGNAAQGELLILHQDGTAFQVIALGKDVPDDRVIMSDVAPVPTASSGARASTSVTVAAAPFGLALVATAHHADGTATLWYDDLVSHKQTKIPTALDARSLAQIGVNGWSRLGVA